MRNSKITRKFANLNRLAMLAVLIGCSVSVFSQTKTAQPKVALDSVSGYVRDAITRKPISGSQIQTQDPKYSAMTDDAGYFVIKFPAYVRQLVVVAPDYNQKEFPLFKGDKKVDLAIFPATNSNYYGNELTVFGFKKRSTVTTAQRTIDLENRSSVTVDADLQKSLGGDIRISRHSGIINSGASMLIRGINSLNANVQPLIVVDGVIYDNQSDINSIHLGNTISALSNIDVNDIQSVSVLRDGTSIYGSKGGNGVILISTTRGRGQATKITASTLIGITERPTTTPMMNSDQYRTYLTDMIGQKENKIAMDTYFMNDDPKFIYYKKYHNETNWTDGIYTQGLTQGYNVAVNGGDDIALYNLSVGFADGKNTLSSNQFNRMNARFNSDITLTKNLSTTFDIAFLQSSKQMRNDGVSEFDTEVINSPGFLSLIKAPFLTQRQYSFDGVMIKDLEDFDFMGIANPNAILQYGFGKSQQTNFNLSIIPSWKFNKNLKLSSHFSFSTNNLSEHLYSPIYGVAPYINFTENIISQNHVKTQFASKSLLFSNTYLNWNKSIGLNKVDLNAGVRFLSENYQADYATGHNTGGDQLKEMNSSLKYITVGGIVEPARSLAYYAAVDYSLLDRYFVQASISTEANSRFGKKAESGFQMLGVSWATFPSVNAGWLISSEKFMQSVKFVDLLKLRAGYGLAGNDGVVSTAANTYFNAVKYSKSAIGLQIYNIGNSDLEWEVVTKRNVGLDANLFNERLALSFDLYRNTTDNLYVLKPLPEVTGIGSYWTNDGKLENKGYELTLNLKVVNTKDFDLTVGGSVSHNVNKLLAISGNRAINNVYGAEILNQVGQPIGQFYGYQTAGVFSTYAQAQDSKLGQLATNGEKIPFDAGDVIFVDNVKDSLITSSDKAVLGNPNPDYFGTFNLGMRYKRFTLQGIFSYSYGNEVYNFLRSKLESGSVVYNQSVAMNNRWITEGQVTNMPKSTYKDPMMNNRFSDRWVEDGSYLRLKSIEASFEVPVKSTYLQGLTIWCSANNLWTLTKYLGSDPEFAVNNGLMYQGIDAGLVPQSRSYFAGLKIYL